MKNVPAGPLRVAIVGFGYWGPNLVRNFTDNDRTRVTLVCDRSPARLDTAAKRYPQVERSGDFDAVCASPDVDLVAIATPITTHFELAKKALLAGKDVFVEKPLCTTGEEAEELGRIAREHGRKIFVDHTFVYNPAVRKMREAVANGADFGRPLYYDSVRANLGLFQADINVLWDLAPHDLSILDYVLDGAVPTKVSCVGVAHFDGGTHNIAYLSLVYDGGFIAHCHLSWLAPVKIRQVIFAGSNKFVIYNDNDLAERIKIYDKGVKVHGQQTSDAARIQYRTGDIYVPFVPADEALKIEVEHIASCYFDGAEPLTGITAGTNMVRILEAAERSMNDGGAPQTLSPVKEKVTP